MADSPVLPVSPMSSSWPSWRSSPTVSSPYRDVQRDGYDSRLQDERKPPVLPATAFEFPRPPPAIVPTVPTVAAESRKDPVYNYKPTALRWWFIAVLAAVLLTFIAVTEHSLRSLPDYGLEYDLSQRLGRSISERQFPRLSPRVHNATAEATSKIPSDPETVALPASTSEVSSKPSVASSSTPSVASSSTSVASSSRPSVESSSSASVATSSRPSAVVSSTVSSKRPAVVTTTPVEQTTKHDDKTTTIESSTPSSSTSMETTRPSPTQTLDSQTSETQTPEAQESATSNGEHQTVEKAVSVPKPAATSTSICFDCSLVFSTATSAYLSLATVTSTIGIQTTIDGKATTVKNVVTSTFSTTAHVASPEADIPSTTVVQQVTTLPDSTTVLQHVTTNSAGSTVSEAVTSTLPGTTRTVQSAVLLHPGQSWITTAGPVLTSTLTSRTALQATTITNAAGETLTSTYLVTLPPTTAVVTATYGTLIGGATRPNPTPPSSSSSSDTASAAVVVVIGISRSQYALASFLPTLLAVLAAMPLRAISANARLFQPFIALAAGPTAAAGSVFLRFTGWRSLWSLPRAVQLRQPVVAVGALLVAGAALLPPLAAEAVRVYVPDDCTGPCPGSLGVDVASGRALQVLLALLVGLLVGMIGLLAWVKTGVRQHPWSIAGMAALGVNREVREVLKGVDGGVERRVEDWEVAGALGGRRFALGSDGGEARYGVRVVDSPAISKGELLRRSRDRFEDDASLKKAVQTPAMPFFLLTLQGRLVLLCLFASVLTLLLYYENSWGNTGFARFMNDQGFGVRFFFTAVGVALGFCMSIFFRCVAVLSPYLLMSHRPLPAQYSILISPPTNPLSGLYSAFRQRHLYLGVLALATLLADFLPVTLSHVPFSVLETSETQSTCAYLSIAILVIMMVAVAASLAVRWPHMPVDPRTIAGALYYLCDSSVLISFDGLAGVERRDRDWMVKSMCVRYTFGTMIGLNGKERVGIEALDAGDGAGSIRA